MNNVVFKESRKRMKLSQVALAEKIGVSLRMIAYYESGEQPITRTIEAALRWVAYSEFALLLPVEFQDELFKKPRD